MNLKKWACDHLKTSNLSVDNFKKILDLDGSTPEPAIRLGDTGMRIPCFDSCQLITTLMWNQFSHGLPGLPKKLESVRVNIGIPVVRTDGLRAVYGHVITKISGMGRFTYTWCSAGALCAKLRFKVLNEVQTIKIHLDDQKNTFISDRSKMQKSQATQTLWEFVRLWIYKAMYENKQNTS